MGYTRGELTISDASSRKELTRSISSPAARLASGTMNELPMCGL